MSVTLAATALIDEAELSTYIGSGSALNADDARRVINRASALVQAVDVDPPPGAASGARR